MSDELVARLRWKAAVVTSPSLREAITEAADEIDRLRAERDTLREIVRVNPQHIFRTEDAAFLEARWGHVVLTPDQAERYGPVIDRAMEAPDE